MPSKYQRKTDTQSWSHESTKNAVQEVLAGRMGYFQASKTFGVPQTTLESMVKKARTELSLEMLQINVIIITS
jgi:transposase-like protein